MSIICTGMHFRALNAPKLVMTLHQVRALVGWEGDTLPIPLPLDAFGEIICLTLGHHTPPHWRSYCKKTTPSFGNKSCIFLQVRISRAASVCCLQLDDNILQCDNSYATVQQRITLI